jgi:hypothetical protein
MEWRATFVPVWEVNEIGEVRNVKLGRIVKPYIHNGYYAVGSTKQPSGRQKVHRLVCWAFHGPPSQFGLCVDHIDRNRLNNRADNLQWLDFIENSKKDARSIPAQNESGSVRNKRQWDQSQEGSG